MMSLPGPTLRLPYARVLSNGRLLMRWTAAWALVVVVALTAIASAHEVTFKGTVVELKASKYAQPGGGFREVQELEVTVVDEQTKKPANRVFTITPETRLLRAGKAIAVSAAGVRKGEAVEVVIDHDIPGDEAIEVRLGVTR